MSVTADVHTVDDTFSSLIAVLANIGTNLASTDTCRLQFTTLSHVQLTRPRTPLNVSTVTISAALSEASATTNSLLDDVSGDVLEGYEDPAIFLVPA